MTRRKVDAKGQKPSFHDDILPLDALRPHPSNPRSHSEGQVEKIVRSIEEFGFTVPILADDKGEIIAGHGRYMAATKLGLKEVPVRVVSGLTEAQKRAYRIADNQLTLEGGWIDELLNREIAELKAEDYDLSLTGFDKIAVDGYLRAFASESEEEDLVGQYSRKIVAPVYEPQREEPPDPEDLVDRDRVEELIEEIKAAKISPAIRRFLEYAAERHARFDYAEIAEFYAHADAKTQRLMERSGLVIVDFDKAIEEGFVRLTEEIARSYGDDHGGSDA